MRMRARSLGRLTIRGSRVVKGVTSVLMLMETLVKPKEIWDNDLRDDYYFALTTFPNLTIRDVDAEVAERAVELRAGSRLRPPDTLQVATCMVEGGSAFVANDERLRSIEDPEIIIMKDYLLVSPPILSIPTHTK